MQKLNNNNRDIVIVRSRLTDMYSAITWYNSANSPNNHWAHTLWTRLYCV